MLSQEKNNLHDEPAPGQVGHFIEGGKNLPNGGFTRNIMMTLQDIVEFRKANNNTGIYISAYIYDSPNPKEANLYADFYLDFDDKEVFDRAREDALAAIWYLTRKFSFDIPVDLIRIYFSGQKGIHLVIPAPVFGIGFDKNLNEYYKLMATEISKHIRNGTLDTKIYDRRRLFRVVNSRHQETGLYKIPLTYTELANLSFEAIKEKARNPVLVQYKPAYLIVRAKQEFEKYKDEWDQRFQKKFDNTRRFHRKPLSFVPACIQELIDVGPQVGQRNFTASVLTSFWKRQGHTEQEIWDKLVAWNNGSLEEKELRRTMQSIFHGDYEYGCSTLSTLATCIGKECPLYKEKE